MPKYFSTAMLAAASLLLGACNGSPTQPTTTESTVAPVTGATDSTKKVRTPGKAVPFVNQTKVGRILGSKSPSPPASRTR